MNTEAILNSVGTWVEQLVVGEQLCPFARQPLKAGRVRFAVTFVTSEAALLDALAEEIARLEQNARIETTLLIHPNVLTEFESYNQFLDDVDELIRSMGVEGTFQVASFHPDYRFAGTGSEDAENYSNRSPYPLLHLLRERSIEAAIDAFDDIDGVPERNIRHLRQIGAETLAARLAACFRDTDSPLL